MAKISIRLHPDEMDRVATSTEPYFDMFVTEPGTTTEVLVYVDTTEAEFMYDPQTYVTDYKSNLATVIKITFDSPNVYTISNIVIPDNVLMPTTNVPSTPDTVFKAKFMLDSTVKFTRLYDSVSKKYAFYTLIENDPAKRAYLLPLLDTTQTGPRSKTVRAVETVDQTETDKYVFELAESDYSNFTKDETTDAVKYANGNKNSVFFIGVVTVAMLALAASKFLRG